MLCTIHQTPQGSRIVKIWIFESGFTSWSVKLCMLGSKPCFNIWRCIWQLKKIEFNSINRTVFGFFLDMCLVYLLRIENCENLNFWLRIYLVICQIVHAWIYDHFDIDSDNFVNFGRWETVVFLKIYPDSVTNCS